MVNMYDIIRSDNVLINDNKEQDVNPCDLREMQQVHKKHSDKLCVFLYARQNDVTRPYIDINFYRDVKWPVTFKQFRIIPGFRFSAEDEEEFLSLIKKKNLYIDDNMFFDVQKRISALFPEWHMGFGGDISRYLDNLYSVSHRSGPKEILYKSGLHNLAYNIDNIDEYNLIGNTPQEIFDMNLRLLRIMNRFGDDVRRMSDESSRMVQKKIYEKYSSYMMKTPTSEQWKYLEEDCWGQDFNRRLFNNLRDVNADIYRRYFDLCDILGDLSPYKKIPNSENIYSCVQLMETIKNHIEDKDIIDEGIKKYLINELLYENDDYEAIIPTSLIQVCNESINMSNCLMSNYIYKLSSGMTHIVFIRKKKNRKESYMDIEISHRKIINARLRFNSLPTVEDYKFLSEYAQNKDLIFEPRELIMGETDYDELFGREDLIAYLDELEDEKLSNIDGRIDGEDFYFDGQIWRL